MSRSSQRKVWLDTYARQMRVSPTLSESAALGGPSRSALRRRPSAAGDRRGLHRRFQRAFGEAHRGGRWGLSCGAHARGCSPGPCALVRWLSGVAAFRRAGDARCRERSGVHAGSTERRLVECRLSSTDGLSLSNAEGPTTKRQFDPEDIFGEVIAQRRPIPHATSPHRSDLTISRKWSSVATDRVPSVAPCP